MIRLAVLIFVVLVALTAPALGADPAWTTFSYPNPPFTIHYPASWVRMSADKLALLVLVDPHTRGLGLVVVGVPVSPGDSVDDLVPELPRIIPRSFSDYRPLRTDRAVLGGRPTIVHYFTGTRNNQRVYVMLAAVTTGTYGYLLFGTTAVDSPRLRDELILLQQIIVRFQPGR